MMSLRHRRDLEATTSPSADSQADTGHKHRGPVGGMQVLCASADARTHDLVREALTGAHVTAASTGGEALARFNDDCFDAYVIDYCLPDWSGVSFCREIRKSDRHALICVYARSRRTDLKERAVRAGADAFLTVPIGPRRFRAEIEKLLRAKR